MSLPPPSGEPLTAYIVADDELLAAAVDEFIHRDPEATRRLYELTDEQERLRQAVEPGVWQLVLRVDEMATARWADLAVAIARWAFSEGRRFPLSIEEASS